MAERLEKGPGKIRGGLVALALAGALAAPTLIIDLLLVLRIKPTDSFLQKVSNFIFDLGAPLLLLILIFAILGIFEGGRSRRLSLYALATTVLFFLLCFVPAML